MGNARRGISDGAHLEFHSLSPIIKCSGTSSVAVFIGSCAENERRCHEHGDVLHQAQENIFHFQCSSHLSLRLIVCLYIVRPAKMRSMLVFLVFSCRHYVQGGPLYYAREVYDDFIIPANLCSSFTYALIMDWSVIYE